MLDIIVQSARGCDFDAVRSLYQSVGYAHAQAEPSIFIDEPLLDEERFRHQLDSQIMLVAKVADLCVGMCACTVLTTDRFPGLRSRKLCHINTIAVDAGYRRQGVGRALYEAVSETAHEHECDAVQLNVWAFNDDAAAFYRSLGMHCVSHRFEQVVQ